MRASGLVLVALAACGPITVSEGEAGPPADARTDGRAADGGKDGATEGGGSGIGYQLCTTGAACPASAPTCQMLSGLSDGMCTHACAAATDCGGDPCIVNPSAGLGAGACAKDCAASGCPAGLTCGQWQLDPGGNTACFPPSWLQ